MRAHRRAGLIVAVLLSTAGMCSAARAGHLPARMAYIDAHAHALYTVVPRRPASVQLVYGKGFPHSPKWSPNGETLAFEASDDSLSSPWSKIVLATRAGHVFRRLLDGQHAQLYSLDWSPDGKRIVYECGDGRTPANWLLCVIDVRTGAHHVLTRPGTDPDTTDHGPFVLSWSPDGKHIAFDGFHDSPCLVSVPGVDMCSQEDVYVANAATGATRRLTDNNSFQPQYSPDGHEIVLGHSHFYKSNTPPTGIYLMSSSGGHLRELVTESHLFHGGYPAWSPDGKQIVYSSGSDGANNGNTDLFTMNISGHEDRTRVTNTPDDNNEASWTAALTTCTVPKLKGKTLKSAKTLIKRAGCKLGKVTGRKSKHVTHQNPAADKDVPVGTRVGVKLG